MADPKNIIRTGKVFSIPFGVSFARVFAAKLLANYRNTPLELADVTIWVPSRRAALALEEAFMALKPSGLVLPAIKPMHLTQEDAELLAFDADKALAAFSPPVSEHARMLYLTQQVIGWQKATRGADLGGSIPHAYESAASLAALSDRLRTQNISFQRLREEIPPDMASHWEMNLQFLKIVFEYYPLWLAENNVADPADLKARLLEVLAEQIRTKPPQGPVYLAGFTDTTPAGLTLMQAVMAAPEGRLVLHGFARDCTQYDLPPTHPHYAINRLMDALGVTPEEVIPLAEPSPQGELMLHAQLPTAYTHLWLERNLPAECAEGLSVVEAENPRLEADAIALVMRRSLETPQKTCALVTTNRQLAARVADRLRHWDITVNDSAGTPLLTTTAGSFFMLVSSVVVQGFKPQLVAQLLAHPLTRGGMEKAEWKAATRLFEVEVLRGVTPGHGLAGLRASVMEATARLEEKHPKRAEKVQRVFAVLEEATTPLRAAGSGTMTQWVRAHIQSAKTLAADPEGEKAESFLEQEDGDTLYQQLEALTGADGHGADMRAKDYHQWLSSFLQHAQVREVYAQHPRLFIWGPLEARLQSADQVIIGGLNEGTWPNLPSPDPWLNRAMAGALGLPPQEMAIGLNAHDFCALASCEDVILSRAKAEGGTPTVPSRYLLRLKAVLDNNTLEAATNRGNKWLETARLWAAHTADTPQPLGGAEVTIPAAAYPEAWSASAVATFMRCPYQFYGQKVMGLRPFDAFDQAPDAADKGELIHRCFEAFLRPAEGLPTPWEGDVTPDNFTRAVAHLEDIAQNVFARISNNASRKVWLSRFEVAAEAFVRTLMQQQSEGQRPAFIEARGEIKTGDLRVHARADRIDNTSHGYIVMDYKTGQVPDRKDMLKGWAPQLSIEGLILQEGGFGGAGGGKPAAEVHALAYWKIGNGEAPFEKKEPIKAREVPDALEATREGLAALDEIFIKNGAPLAALPEDDTCRLCDFAGICRRHEWDKPTRKGEEV